MYHFEQLRENKYGGTSEHKIAKIVQFLTDLINFDIKQEPCWKSYFLLFSLENESDFFLQCTVKRTIHDNFYPVDVN